MPILATCVIHPSVHPIGMRVAYAYEHFTAIKEAREEIIEGE